MTAARLHVHTATLTIRWGDMDSLGHVNNTAYFRYMEQARLEWLFKNTDIRVYQQGKGPVIANASCNFLVPIVYPATLEIRMYLSHPGRSSVMSYYDIFVGGTKMADGASKLVWVDFTTGRSTPLPEHIAAPLRALEREAS